MKSNSRELESSSRKLEFDFNFLESSSILEEMYKDGFIINKKTLTLNK
jgi:hypothetical protein